MANQVKHRTTAAVIALLLTALLVAFELRLNRLVVVDFGQYYTSVYSSEQAVSQSRSNLSNNTTTVNHVTVYPISDSVIQEYNKWHILVWNLSEINLHLTNWTPVINDWKNHPTDRNDRFPSITERIQYYMGKWYNASIPMYGNKFQNGTFIQRKSTREFGPYSNILVDFINKDTLWNCYNSKKEYKVFSPYCRDYMDIAILHSQQSGNILHYIGDGIPNVPQELQTYPIFGKVRPLLGNDNNIIATVQPILLPLNRKRHYGITSKVPNNDIPWKQKVDKAIWRGKYDTPRTKHIAYSLVSKYINSTLVYAKFSKHTSDVPSHDMVGEYMTMKEQLTYKYIISIEGNDVSSGIKWMLLSNSVVLTPPFTMESWAMEGALKPYVHYLPLMSDMSNVEDMIQWAEAHPKETQLISERSTLYMYDMFYHPTAIEDEKKVIIGIMERYEQNFGYDKEMRKQQSTFATPQLDQQQAHQRFFPSINERVKYLMGKWYHNIDAISMHRSNIQQMIASHQLLNNNISNSSLFIASGQQLYACALDNNSVTSYPTDIRLMCQSSLQHFDERNTADLKSNSFNRLRLSKAGRKIQLAPISSWNKDNATMNKESKRVILDDTIKILCYARSCSTYDDTHVPYFANYRRNNDVILWPFSDRSSDYYIDLIKQFDINYEDKVPSSKSSDDGISHIRDMLQYRYLVTEHQGTVNDDLVWMLLSQSVVLMSDTRQDASSLSSSWLMESFLEPYIHYIPIASDYTDVDEKVTWCETNVDKVKMISKRATAYVHYILFAEKENEEVKFQVMERYSKIFA